VCTVHHVAIMLMAIIITDVFTAFVWSRSSIKIVHTKVWREGVGYTLQQDSGGPMFYV